MHQPIDLVILMLGTNDGKSQFSPNASAIAKGIKEMVSIIQHQAIYNEHMKVPDILLISPIHIREGYDAIPSTYEQFQEQSYQTIKKLAPYYQAIARQYHCDFMDAAKFAKASLSDCIHMDKENHFLLAKAIFEHIKK